MLQHERNLRNSRSRDVQMIIIESHSINYKAEHTLSFYESRYTKLKFQNAFCTRVKGGVGLGCPRHSSLYLLIVRANRRIPPPSFLSSGSFSPSIHVYVRSWATSPPPPWILRSGFYGYIYYARLLRARGTFSLGTIAT